MKKPKNAGHLYCLNFVSGLVSCVCGWREQIRINSVESAEMYASRAISLYNRHLEGK